MDVNGQRLLPDIVSSTHSQMSVLPERSSSFPGACRTFPDMIPTIPTAPSHTTRQQVYQPNFTFHQPQMPGAVLQPSIPGYRTNPGHLPPMMTYGQPNMVNQFNGLNCTGINHGIMNNWNPIHSNTNHHQMVPPHSGRQMNSGTKGLWSKDVPCELPWAQSMGKTVQFDAADENIQRVPQSTGRRQSRKRRSSLSSDEDDNYTSKLHITEDRIAARMNELHLRPQTNGAQCSGGMGQFDQRSQLFSDGRRIETFEEIDNRLTVDDDEDDANNNDAEIQSNEPTIVLAPEVVRQMESPQDLLPKAVMERWYQPSMQVVLWKPPGNHITEIVADQLKSATSSATPSTSSASSVSDNSTISDESMQIVVSPDVSLGCPDDMDDDMDL